MSTRNRNHWKYGISRYPENHLDFFPQNVTASFFCQTLATRKNQKDLFITCGVIIKTNKENDEQNHIKITSQWMYWYIFTQGSELDLGCILSPNLQSRLPYSTVQELYRRQLTGVVWTVHERLLWKDLFDIYIFSLRYKAYLICVVRCVKRIMLSVRFDFLTG